MAVTFPSVEWFQALADIANKDDGFKKIGGLDAIVAFKVEGKIYNVTFDVLTVLDIHEIGGDDLRDADFVIELAPGQWRGMVEDIKANGAAGRDWTLNALDLTSDEPIHRNLMNDSFRADKFFRYSPSLQRFVDNASRIDTVFDVEAATA